MIGDLSLQIEELLDKIEHIRRNKNNYYNWALTMNRIELQINSLRQQRRVVQILES